MDIRTEVCERFGITKEDLFGWGRPRHVAWPRMFGMWRARQETKASLKQVAAVFGVSDHTSVVHAEQRFADPAFRQRFDEWAAEREAFLRRPVVVRRHPPGWKIAP